MRIYLYKSHEKGPKKYISNYKIDAEQYRVYITRSRNDCRSMGMKSKEGNKYGEYRRYERTALSDTRCVVKSLSKKFIFV
jgi:hypothetical protein